MKVYNKWIKAFGALLIAVMLFAALPAGEVKAQTDPVHNETKDTYYTSIQAAINDADAGDTIRIAAGTYSESLGGYRDFELFKSLNLIGAGATQTIVQLTGLQHGMEIRPDTLGTVHLEGIYFTNLPTNDYSADWPIIIGETGGTFNSVTLKDIRVEKAETRNVHFAAGATYNSILMEYCNIHNSGALGASIAGTTHSLTVKDSTFWGNGALEPNYGYGLDLSGSSTNITNVLITGGQFNYNWKAGILMAGVSDVTVSGIEAIGNGNFGISIDEWQSKSQNILIENVTASDNSLDGINIAPEGPDTIENVDIIESTITGNDRNGVNLVYINNGSNNPGMSDITMRRNVITGNGNKAIEVYAWWEPMTITDVFDAKANWFGASTGPTSADITMDNLEYNPWCYNEACTELYLAAGGSIQHAVDIIAEIPTPSTLTTYTIYVAEGTYNETVGIIQEENKNIVLQPEIIGGDYGDVTLTGQIQVDGDGRSSGAESLTIQGFTFDLTAAGNQDAITSYDVAPAQTYVYSHNIYVKDSTFLGDIDTGSDVAVRAQATGGHYNYVLENLTATSMHSLGQMTSVEDVTVKSSTVSGGKSGVNLTNSPALVDGLTYSGTAYGVRTNADLTIKNSSLTSSGNANDLSDPDTALVLRNDTVKTITIENSLLQNSVAGNYVISNTNGSPAGKISLVVTNLDTGDGSFDEKLLGGFTNVWLVDTVGGTQTITFYTTIQSAIDAAVGGEKVLIFAGHFPEDVNVDKSVSLEGSGMVETFTDPLVVDDWYTDRYEPGVFEVDTFLGESVLKHGVLATDFQASTFYNYQGKKFDITTTGPEQTWSIDLYVDPAWETGQANAGFWATGYDSEGSISAYPIVAWRSGGTDPAGFYSFDYINGGWLPLFEASADDYGKWHNFAMTYTVGTGVEYFVDGVSRLTFADPDTVKLANIILNVYNYGEDYDVYWDNFGAWDAKVVGQMDIDASNVGVNGLILSNPGSPYGMQIDALADTVDITENLFADIGSESLSQNVKGIYLVHGSDNVTIENNLFERIHANEKSVNAIFSGDSNTTDPAEGLVIQDNRFQNITSQTKGGYGILLNNGAGNPAALIDGNRFSGISGGWTHAVGMEGSTLNAEVTDNTFYNLTAAGADNSAVFFEANPDGASVDVSGNRFQHVGYGVLIHPNDLSTYDYTVDASLNYWGSACGSSSAAADAGPNVIYSPWYTDVTLSFTGSGVVGEYIFPTGATTDAMNSIIACAAPGSTLTFEGGTYDGGLIVPADREYLTFELNGVTVGAGSPAFTINGDNIIINGPGLLEGDGTDDAVLVADGVYDFTIDEVEITDWANGIHYDGVVTNTLVVDNFIHDLTGDGVLFDEQPVAETDVSLFIQGNLFLMTAFDDYGVIDGYGVNAPADLDVTYNSWGAFTGPVAGTDLPTAITSFTPWTHADLYVEQSGGGTSYDDQVVKDGTITYTVYGNLKNVMGADFVLKYPSNVSVASTALGGLFDVENILQTTGELNFIGYQQGTETTSPSAPLDGQNLALFSVTFTGDVLGKNLVLDLDETTDLFSMAPDEGPSNNVYGTVCEDVTTLEVIDLPTIDIIPVPNQDYIVGLPIEFTVLVENPGGGAYADLDLDFDLPTGAILTYWDGDSFEPVGDPSAYDIGALAVDGEPAFLFQVTFVDDSDTTISVDLVDNTPDPDVVLATTDETFTLLGAFDVIGTIAMQGRTVRADVPLTLTDVDGAPVYGSFTDDSGPELAYNVLFEGVDGSIYEITTLQPRYLNVTADLDKQIYVRGAYTIPALELKGGNAVWEDDNVIDINDASKVGTNYNEPSFDQNADVNFDLKVNIQDLALVGGNYDETSASAYADWLAPGFFTEGAIVSGQIQNTSVTEFAGNLDGDYTLTISGDLTWVTPGQYATFTGTVGGDIVGTVTGSMDINGVDTLFGRIEVSPGEFVAIVGIFPKSGLNGHFYGKVIADYTPSVTAVTVSSTNVDDEVDEGMTLQMFADVDPDNAPQDMVWSVWANESYGETELATIDPNTGLLTALSPGDVVVIAKALDGSHVDGMLTITINDLP